MKDLITDARREFTARYFADISKAIVAVGLASKFFIELPAWMRTALPITGFILFIVAYFMHPKGGNRK